MDVVGGGPCDTASRWWKGPVTKLHLYQTKPAGSRYPRYHWILYTMNGREMARSKPEGYVAYADMRRVARLIFPWRSFPARWRSPHR